MKNFFLILFLAGSLISCDKSQYNLTPSVAGYPMRTGMKWTYERQVIIKEYESSASGRIVAVDTLNSEVYVWVEKDTVLDKKTLKVFKSREGDSNFISSRFVFNDKEGFKSYAYQNPGSLATAHSRYLKSPAVRSASNDSIQYESAPLLDLKLPLTADSRWISKHPTVTDSLQIEKSVTGTETLTLTGMKINCYKLEWTYMSDSLFNGYKTTEWFSEKGLMKRIRTFDRVTFTDENNKPLYDGQYMETLILKSFRYK